MNNANMLDWAKLVSQNRVKAAGIPWSPEELHAIHDLKMDPDDVRAGYLTPESLAEAKEEIEDEEKETGKESYKRLNFKKTTELIEIGKKLGIEFDEKVIGRNDLIEAIKQKTGRAEKEKTAPQDGESKPEEDKQGEDNSQNPQTTGSLSSENRDQG